jgi:hypothetical protein
MVDLLVKDVISKNLDHADGKKLFGVVSAGLAEGPVLLDFSDVDVVTPSFLNTSFRELVKTYDYDFLRQNLNIKNANSLVVRLIKQSVDLALKEKESNKISA